MTIIFEVRTIYRLHPMYRFLLFCHNKRSSYELDFTIEEPFAYIIYRKFFILPKSGVCRFLIESPFAHIYWNLLPKSRH